MRRALVVLGLGVGVGLVGCAMPHEYTITVKDPRAVRLDGVPTPATVADGAPVVATGADGDHWALVMFREPDGGLRLRCAACSRDAYLAAGDGVMHVVADAEPEAVGLVRPSPSEVDRGAVALLPYHYCGFPSKHGCRAAAWDGVRVTPWSNVTEIRARNGPRQTGSPLVLVAAGVAGLVGTGLGAAPSRRRQIVGFSRLEGINARRERLFRSRRAEVARGKRSPDHERSANQSDRVC